MMLIEACKSRVIDTVNAVTPVIVPSFSSKGFPEVKKIHEFADEFIVDSSLVSAYDLHHGFLDENSIYSSDVVFIDSGGYEKTKDHELSELYSDEYLPLDWTEKNHIELIRNLNPMSSLVIVNFDSNTPQPIEEQVRSAKDLFSLFPDYGTDFLCKPSTQSTHYVDVNKITDSILSLVSFNIIGITEKQLGQSLYERCSNLYRIRSALAAQGFDTPIHVFGCIDPITTLTYFLCGADIFDGLSWLRFSFHNYMALYINNAVFTGNKSKLTDIENRLTSYSENLSTLTKLTDDMRRFTKTYDFRMFELSEPLINSIIDIVRTVGIVL